MPRAPTPLLALWLLTLACGAPSDDAPPSVAGESPEQAAEISTAVVCDYFARCGHISIICADCDSDNESCGGCTAEHHDVDDDECFDDVGTDLAAGFACETVTADEEADIDACLAALAEQACPSVEAAEAWANGGGGDNPAEPPAVCNTLAEVGDRCADDGDETDPMPAG